MRLFNPAIPQIPRAVLEGGLLEDVGSGRHWRMRVIVAVKTTFPVLNSA